MENVRQRLNFQLITREDRIEWQLSSAFFKESVIFKEDLVGISKYRQKLELNKPIYAGATVLEHSKLVMYKFYYRILPIVFHEIKFELLYTDTDSFILAVMTDDVTPYIKAHAEFFDCSEYPPNHTLFDPTNAKVPGKFKNEVPKDILAEYVALCAKVYAFKKWFAECEVKKAKGVKSHIVKNQLTFQNYFDCLFSSKDLTVTQRLFRSDLHELYTVEQRKKGLILSDNKRIFEDRGIVSKPYGYK